MNEPRTSSRVTYPLALLFLILTGAAVVAALVGPALRDVNFREVLSDPGETVGALIAAGICGSLLGAILGLFQFQRWLGVLLGVVVGGLIGPLAVILTTVPTSQISSVVPAVFIGSGVLLLIAWLVRPPISPPEDEEIVPAKLASTKDERTKL